MAIGQGYVKHGSGRINTKVIDGKFWAFYSGRWHPVKKAWAWYGGTKTWKQWYPHKASGGGGTSGRVYHTVTLRPSSHIRPSWSISSSRHVTRQTITITASTINLWFTLNGTRYEVVKNSSRTFTLSTSARRATIIVTSGSIKSLSVRYTYY